MQLDDLLKLAWSIAELEARALGSRVIEPTHFLLAALKIVDSEFPAQLDALNIETEEWKSMCENARSLRNYLDIIPDKVTEVRRRVRHRLSRNAEPPVEPSVVIHRSRKTRAAFFDAASLIEGDTLTLMQVIKSMFELEFLEVIDMRWRGATQTV